MSKKNDIIKKIKTNKNILSVLAVVLALVIVATIVVVAIRNDREIYVDQDGIEHWLVTDENGNTTLDDNGNMVVYATDLDGEILTDVDGKPEYRYVKFPDSVINEKDNIVETPFYKLSMPKEWEVTEDGVFHLKDNENVTVKGTLIQKISGTIEEYMIEEKENFALFTKEMKEKYPNFESVQGYITLTMKDIKFGVVEYKMKNDKGVEYYIRNYLYIMNGNLYIISYECDDYSYNADINMDQLLDQGYVAKSYYEGNH